MSEQSWIRKNWLGLVGVVVGLIGISSSVYFYKISEKARKPILLEEPLRSLIVEANSLKDFPLKVVNRKGNTVEKDISSMRFYFWNDGRESIKKTDILKPIQLILSSSDVQIIDFKILSSSRPDIVQPALSLTTDKSNSVEISFEILEQDDGFVAQIIYAGLHNADLVINGTIEGVKLVQSNNNISAYHFYKSLFLLIGLPIGGILFSILAVFFVRPSAAKLLLPALGFLAENIEEAGKKLRMALIIGIITPLLIIPFGIYTKEKSRIEKRAHESMLSIVPESIKKIPSNRVAGGL